MNPPLQQLTASNQIGTQIRSARTARHISQTDLAKRAGTTHANIARIEASRSNPTLATLEAIAESLDGYIQVRLRHL